MRIRLPTIKIVSGETDHISMSGKITRRPTILIRVGKQSLSKKAFIIGVALAVCQLLDGLLTYIGLTLLGVHMEGNGFLRTLMYYYGMAPALFVVKLIALAIAVGLALHSHRRRWMRPVLLGIVAFYLVLAVIPWTIIISKELGGNQDYVLSNEKIQP
jgi:hypothetical protein